MYTLCSFRLWWIMCFLWKTLLLLLYIYSSRLSTLYTLIFIKILWNFWIQDNDRIFFRASIFIYLFLFGWRIFFPNKSVSIFIYLFPFFLWMLFSTKSASIFNYLFLFFLFAFLFMVYLVLVLELFS